MSEAKNEATAAPGSGCQSASSGQGQSLHPSTPTAGALGTPALHPSTPTAGVPGTPVLAGWRILVSRARDQAGALSVGLRALGAEVLEIPFIEIRPPRSYKCMDESLKLVAEYEWLILTSANGARAMFERMEQLNVPRSALGHLNIVAIGPATRTAIEREGLKVGVMPKEYVAESVVEALGDQVRGKRVLLCRAKIARDVIPRELRRIGAFLDVVEAYETVTPQSSRVELRAVLRDPQRRPHLITFTSASTVQNYLALLGIRSGRSPLIDGVLNASIGPITSDELRKHQLHVDVQAAPSTIPGLIDAIVQRAGSFPRPDQAVSAF